MKDDASNETEDINFVGFRVTNLRVTVQNSKEDLRSAVCVDFVGTVE